MNWIGISVQVGPCKPFFSFLPCNLGKTLAFSSAQIDKSWFKAPQVEDLTKNFPDRATIQEPNILFKGPVFIAQGKDGPIVIFLKYSDPFFRRIFQLAVGMTLALALFSKLYNIAHPAIGTRGLKIEIGGTKYNLFSTRSLLLFSSIFGLASAYVAGKIFDQIMR
ncbi:MAG: hypothetical protein JSR58_00380 [Verrucomicrobia bacterium]|nr:hypothetical protein [Verrucomicrobiota bacterium]